MAVIISNNSISDSGGDGIRVEGELDLAIQDNDVQRSGGHGINVGHFDVATLDNETKQLLEELKNALNARNTSSVKKLLNVIADKSMDLMIALMAGQLLK